MDDYKARYDRNIKLSWLGESGQDKLKSASVLVIGAGGLGSASLMYLASAGIGKIGIADYDTIDHSNMNRQVIHSAESIGMKKTISAQKRIKEINPSVITVMHEYKVDRHVIKEVASEYDFIIDATDNFESKFEINDGCLSSKKSFSHAGALGAEGQVFTHVPGTGCLRCIFPEKPKHYPTSLDEGILGSVAGTLGTIQATEAIKYISGAGDLLTDRFLRYDALKMTFKIFGFSRRKGCVCE